MSLKKYIESLYVSDTNLDGIGCGAEPSNWVHTIAALKCAAAIDCRKPMTYNTSELKVWLEENAESITIYDHEVHVESDFLDCERYTVRDNDLCLELALKYNLVIKCEGCIYGVEHKSGHGYSQHENLGHAILGCISKLPKDIHELAQKG